MRFKSGDVGQVLEVLISVDGTRPNMSGSTVTLYVPGNTKTSFAMTPGGAGQATYTVLANDFGAGTYLAYVKYVSGAVTLYTDKFWITVESST